MSSLTEPQLQSQTAASAEQPQLRDISGPSALSGGWRRLWELVLLIAVTEFKRTYFGTVFGYVWSVARPLALFAVLLEVFTHVFRIGSQVPHYPVFLLLNMVLFGFFQESTITAVSSIVGQEGIVRKTQFPRLAIPLSVVLTAFFNLALNLVVVFIFILAFGVSPRVSWLLLALILVALFTFATAVSMIVASLYPRFRDIGIIWTVFVTAMFYATPVLYPLERVGSATLRGIITLNPLAPVFELSRRWIIDPHAPWPGGAQTGGAARLLIAAGTYLVVCVAAVWIFNREAPRIAEEL